MTLYTTWTVCFQALSQTVTELIAVETF